MSDSPPIDGPLAMTGVAASLRTARDMLTQKRYRDAEAIYREIERTHPENFDAIHNLGLILLQSNDLPGGLALLERAARLNPQSPEALNNIGGALQALNRPDESLKHYAKAIALRPQYADAHNNLGTALRTLGLLAEAVGAFQTAIALAPNRPTFYRNLAESMRVTPDDPVVAALERMLPKVEELPHEEQIQLRFALGKVYADCGEHARSFHHLEIGNAMQRRLVVYDEPQALGLMERIRRVFTPELMRARQGCGEPSSLPVFVVGMPRSGTTLVEQILASHPNIHGGGESFEIGALIESLRAGFPESIVHLDNAEIARLGETYLQRIGRPERPVARVTDKMPLNFRYLGLIHLMLPNAKIIHIRRDPLDTCLSCFSILFTGNQPYTYDLGELGRFYRAYARLMDHWRTMLPAGTMLEISYEELVADLERQARRMISHCGLGWDDSCLAFHTTRRKVRTASAAQVRQPIYAASIGRAAPYRSYLRPLSEALGEGKV